MENNLNLGQHFLVDKTILKEIIDVANIKKTETILEIGAGNGIVSKELAQRCKHLDIVEIDTRLKIYLDDIVKKYNNINIYYQDAIKFDFSKYKKIVTSLPYNILEPFIKKCAKNKVENIIFLIGDKYALSLKNFNDNKIFSYIQLYTYAFYSFVIHSFVDKKCFNPQPHTGSYIVELIKKDDNLTNDAFMLQQLFTQEDKKIKNAFVEGYIRLNKKNNIVCTQKQSKAMLDKLNISDVILNKYLPNLTNTEITVIYNAIKNIQLFEN